MVEVGYDHSESDLGELVLEPTLQTQLILGSNTKLVSG